MAFIDQEYDMTGTIFTVEHLNLARSFLVGAIQKHDPAWLVKPTGYLSLYWHDDALPAVCYLIELGRILSTLDKNVTKKSEVILVQKFKRLLRETKETDHKALLTELQVACMLSERASPIALHPLVPEELLGKSNEPPSPDFGIRLPDSDVAIEVTVFHLGALNEWDRSANRLSGQISRLPFKMKSRRIVYVYLPISFRQIDLLRETIKKLCEEMSLVDCGKKNFNGTINIEWEPMPHIVTDLNGLEGLPNGIKYATFGPEEVGKTPAVAIETRPSGNLYKEVLLKSLRNTLNLKRKQFPHEGSYFIIMKLGHYRLHVDDIISLLNERIWPNPDYGWITGIAVFKPREQFAVNDNLPSLNFIFNPNTRNKPSEAFLALVEGRETYHL